MSATKINTQELESLIWNYRVACGYHKRLEDPNIIWCVSKENYDKYRDSGTLIDKVFPVKLEDPNKFEGFCEDHNYVVLDPDVYTRCHLGYKIKAWWNSSDTRYTIMFMQVIWILLMFGVICFFLIWRPLYQSTMQNLNLPPYQTRF